MKKKSRKASGKKSRKKRVSKYPSWVRYLMGAVRKVFAWSPHKRTALMMARNSDGFFTCAGCSGVFGADSVQVDHIDPIGPFKGDWGDYINRTFCEQDNLQVLCKGCHKVKSKADNIKMKEVTNG